MSTDIFIQGVRMLNVLNQEGILIKTMTYLQKHNHNE